MATLNTDIRYIKGVGEARAKSLAKLGITDLRSLLSYFPRAYDDRRAYKKIADLIPGENACVCAVIAGEPKLSRIRKGLDLIKLRAVDETGALELTYFNQSYLKNTFHTGDAYVFFGRAEGTPSRPQMTNPLFEREGTHQITGRIMPIYPLTAGVSQSMLYKAVEQGLAACVDELPDILPEDVRLVYQLCHTRFAYENIHFPADDEALSAARRRLAFEELFLLALGLKLLRERRTFVAGKQCKKVDLSPFFTSLPFSLTGAQRRAIGDIARDLTGQRPMNRLVQGDVGSGKTVVQHQLAKWSDVDIVVYIGCGERGNEMTQALQEFSELVDPRTGKSLMDRTVLIANTSNMPVAAREASIYTGITLAEYYRDMGYHAAMMADSTSRWAEALREISGRLEEMPADEGYPAYLPSRLAEFYERAGYVRTLNGAEGSVSVIGAVSPQGNDFSEPVTQNTKRFTRCFWALDKSLAYARHYPAINWNDSYSEYLGDLGGWYYDNVGHDFMSCRERIANLLLQENNLMQIVKLIGSDVLPDDQKLTIEIARVIRVGFLQQNAFHAVDTYVPLEKQLKMMETILYLYDKCAALVAKQVPVSRLLATGLFDELVQMKYTVPNDDLSKLDELQKAIDTKLAAVAQG